MAQSSTSEQSDRNDLSDNDGILDVQNRVIVIAESPARAIAANRVTSVRWRSYLPPKQRKQSSWTLRSVLLRFDSRDWRSFRVTFVPCGTAECWRATLAERNLIHRGQSFDIFCVE